MCHGVPCDLPGCSYRATAGFGQKRLKPSVRGRTKREQKHFADNPWCQCEGCPKCYGPLGDGRGAKVYAGCFRAATEINHLDKRGLGGWNRNNSRLGSFCHECHEEFHA